MMRSTKADMLVLFVCMIPSCVFGSDLVILKGMTEAHNRVRAEVGLEGLGWSDDLAMFAREWAEHLATEKECHIQHRPRQGGFLQLYGENLFWGSAIRRSDGKRTVQDITPETVVQSWAREAADFSYASNTCRVGRSCGHYTQIIWRETLRFGCGRAVCPDNSQIWVCNYDPPGNVRGQKPY